MKKSTKVTLSALLLTTLGLAACGNGSTDTTGNSTDTKSITITTFGELTTLDSAVYDDVPTSDMIGQAFEGLYRVTGDNDIELGMAEKDPTISADGLVYTFNIRPDAVWSDGNPVTANDFVFTYRKLVDPKEATGAQSVDVFKNGEKVRNGELPVEELGVKAIDDKTLEITLEYPAPYLPKLLTGTRFLPQSEKVEKEQGDKYGTSSDTVVSNGPFTVQGWTGSEVEWQLVKNDKYWDAANVALDSVKVNVSKEVSTSVTLFDAGEVQYTAISDQFVEQYQSQPTFHTQPKALTGYMSYNVDRPTTGNVHFRRALAMAFDKEALVKNVLKDGSIALNGIVPTDFGTNPTTGADFRADSGNYLAFNVAEAQKEWELAKADLGVSEVTVTLITSDTGTSKLVGEYLQAQIQTNLPGVTFNLQPVPLKNRLELQRADDFDIFYGTWTPDYQDPVNFLQQYTTNGGINFANYSNPAYDEAVSQVQNNLANDPSARWNKMLEAEKIVMDDAIVAPIYQGAQSYLLADNVTGLEVLPFGRSINLRQVNLK
ncbi:peptide ABC transporter substrate-binding protein [Granulicatella seriolae]|uniref:Peptide ABC transporter substrate-binding protein n=1 Tax=Granulicatella seriolae TaxID=2967226 RepID=A0ABT1WPL8_9LACT|nr:peptide ABC transporter substrate-binding protein [Granulicatella seriolae]